MPFHSTYTQIQSFLSEASSQVVALQKALTATKALGPENGGDGEWEKAQYIHSYLTKLNLAPISFCNAPDKRVSRGERPNLITRIPGQQKRTLWIFGHLDVVGVGDTNAWQSDPWDVTREGDWLYGRGVEDNQQAIVSMLLLAEALAKVRPSLPELSLGLVFMADEENGSKYGLSHILKQSPELFASDDIFLVPDFGSSNASMIEIAEKAQLWLKVVTRGTQCHASMPHLGKNAFLAGADLVTQLHGKLSGTFTQTNPLFNPPTSTFVPTRHEINVDAINILPGQDVFYLDCRVLPETEPEDVLACARMVADEVAARHHVQTTIEIVQLQRASSVSVSCPHIAHLQEAISTVYGCAAKAVGVGGGTVAAHLRECGYPALVWACLENTCHQPNERSSIAATCKDAQVFAHLLMSSYA